MRRGRAGWHTRPDWVHSRSQVRVHPPREEACVSRSQADVETRLTTMLGFVNDWLKHAEAKNGVVVGLASAGSLATLAVAKDLLQNRSTDPIPAVAVVALVLGEAALLASL